MTIRSRKFFGGILLLGFIAGYAVGAMALAVDVIGETNKLTELVFYVVAGILWIFPARMIIAWMQRPDVQ